MAQAQTRKYFGTDGIRGKANVFPITPDMALKVAMASARVIRLSRGNQFTERVIIGKDTRISGYMLEEAMAAGFVSMGMEVILMGPIPTPAVALLTRSMRCDIGVMISASHNPYDDNGIKIFGADGYKLDDNLEQQIEQAIDDPKLMQALPTGDLIGKATRLDDALGRYSEFIKSCYPKGQTLDGLKIVIDCANGAAYKVAPQLLWELEADIVSINCNPNGMNINHQCGALHPEGLAARVLLEKADIGIALDGDADRLLLIDECGAVIDGDQILGLLTAHAQENGRLKGKGAVSTVMSNLGLERFLESRGLSLLRTAVGDRYVVEAMRRDGYNVGGEQSGHLIFSDYGTTGDGLLAALQVLSILKERGRKASETLKVFSAYPQMLKNIRYQGRSPMDKISIKEAIIAAQTKMSAHDGRVLVRASGTEPLIRVMAEGPDESLVEQTVSDLSNLIERLTTGEAA